MKIQIIIPVTGVDEVTEDIAIEALNNKMTDLIDNNVLKGPIDEVLINYHQNESGYPVAEVDSANVIDLSKLNKVTDNVYMTPTLDTKLVNVLGNDEMKQFSQASINDRLKIAKRNPKLRLRYMVMDYKNYWKSKQSILKKDPQMVKNLKNMFLQDMNGLMVEILPFIGEGKQLSQLIGLNQVTQGMNTIARDLSLTYRRAMRANDTQGQIPKTIFNKLKTQYTEFMNTLVKSVLPGVEEMLPKNEESAKESPVDGVTKGKTFSYTESGRIKLFS